MVTPFLPRRDVLRMAIITESLLALLATVWIWAFSLELGVDFSVDGLLHGVLAALPLLALNIFTFSRLSREDSPWPIYNRFKRSVVFPICGDLTVCSALLLALASGLAEELLFRGALQTQFALWTTPVGGAIVSSALFSYVHFIGSMRQYWQLALFYLFFGLYFAALLIGTGNLLVPTVTHAFYNFVVILYLRYYEIPSTVKRLR